jgi:uncharacterized protein (TIGR02145 family)
MTSTYCDNNMNENETLTLTDKRNNQNYTIRKLADNNCWMINNLSISDITLTPGDTNTISDWALPKAKISGVASQNDKQIWGPITPSDYNNLNHNSDHFGGNLYNYQVAPGNANATSGSALYDICPKNWRMPTGGRSGEFRALYNASGSSPTDASYFKPDGPFAGIYSGYYYIDSFDSQSNEASYWSSTVDRRNGAFSLQFEATGNINPSIANNMYLSLAVRCLVKSP